MGRRKSRFAWLEDRPQETEILEYGVFEWTGTGRYPKEAAIKTFKTKAAAERAANKMYNAGQNVVARTIHTGIKYTLLPKSYFKESL